MDFKDKHTFDERTAESNRIRSRRSDRIPVIAQRAKYSNKACPIIDKNKYLVPIDLSVGQFLWVLRTRLRLPPDAALFVFINGVMPAVSTLMSTIDINHRDPDGFVYIYYNMENTFG